MGFHAGLAEVENLISCSNSPLDVGMDLPISLGKTNAFAYLSYMVQISMWEGDKCSKGSREGEVMDLCEGARDPRPCIGQIEHLCEKKLRRYSSVPALGCWASQLDPSSFEAS